MPVELAIQDLPIGSSQLAYVRALYDGELLGRPFRSVAKTFQVRVWRDLRRDWDALAAADRARLEALLPPAHGLDRS